MNSQLLVLYFIIDSNISKGGVAVRRVMVNAAASNQVAHLGVLP